MALAEKGVAAAQHNLGVMYADGEGVPQNFREAVKWYRKAAEQGDEQGQYNLGVMYHLGHGVLKNDVTTITWWTIAAANGHEIANENKGVVTKDMTPDQIDEAEELFLEMIKKNPKLLNK